MSKSWILFSLPLSIAAVGFLAYFYGGDHTVGIVLWAIAGLNFLSVYYGIN